MLIEYTWNRLYIWNRLFHLEIHQTDFLSLKSTWTDFSEICMAYLPNRLQLAIRLLLVQIRFLLVIRLLRSLLVRTPPVGPTSAYRLTWWNLIWLGSAHHLVCTFTKHKLLILLKWVLWLSYGCTLYYSREYHFLLPECRSHARTNDPYAVSFLCTIYSDP